MLQVGPTGATCDTNQKNGKWKCVLRTRWEGSRDGIQTQGSLLLGMEAQGCSLSKVLEASCSSGSYYLLFAQASRAATSPSVVDLDSLQRSRKCCKGATVGAIVPVALRKD